MKDEGPPFKPSAMTIPQAFELALQRHQAGRLAEAEALYRQILAADPNHPGALHLLGLIVHQAGRHDLAVDLIRQSLALKPNNHAAHCNLGVACHAIGRLDEAIAAYRRALELKPDFLEAQINLGAAFSDQGQLDQAVAGYRLALQISPNSPAAHNNLGNALSGLRQFDEAIAAYRRALELEPGSAEALNNLGAALRNRGEVGEAMAAYRQALQIKPDDPSAHSNLIFSLHLRPDAEAICEEHRLWNRRFGDSLKPVLQAETNDPAVDGRTGNHGSHGVGLPYGNDRAVGRRLRVGYVSPDFRDQPVGRFVLPVIERHDRERFEILCYFGAAGSDWMTERIRALAGGWRSTVGVSDTHMAEMIREDEVDILVDLSLHTAGNRLPVFARRPAPVQVTWLGYPGSAGLPAIDYRLTDARMDPLGERPVWSAEEPVRLPDCWCCYQPVDDSPEINALPALSAQGVTFGSLNNFAKVNEGALALWARVLEAVKGARLLMFCPEGRARERVRGLFVELGIAGERVEFVGFAPRWEYLSLYHRIDLALDPFPCNGMTTTCDALWMGVPVLTLPGAMPVSRAGLSLLSSVGLEALAASSEEDYVRIAAELATDLPRLADLRATLRARMLASPLMDAPRFARNIEAAYRKMWQHWCAGGSGLRKD